MPGLGWTYGSEDWAYLHAHGVAFDARLLQAAGVSIGEPRPVSYRGILPVEFQGGMGACAGHAVEAAQQCLSYAETGVVVRPSRMLAYWLAQKFSGTFGADRGATVAGAVRGAEYGNCLEEECPYPGAYTADVPAAALRAAGAHKIGSHAVLKSYDEVLAWRRLGMGPVLAGIKWWESFAGSDGVLRARDYGVGRMLGGHLVPLLSESKAVDAGGRPYLDLRNSHGTQWGDGGWALVEPALIELWCRDRFTVVVGVARLNPWSARQRIAGWMRKGVFG